MPGGIYIIHMSCAWDGTPDMDHNTWEMERDGVKREDLLDASRARTAKRRRS